MATAYYEATAGLLRLLSGGTPSLTPPSPPSVLGITAGDTQLTVTYARPVSDGGSPITSYTVTVSPGSHVVTGIGPSVFQQTISGLTNGTSYRATVTAINAIGSSTSLQSASVTPTASPPGKPSAANTGVPVGAVGDPRASYPGGFAALTLVDGLNGIMPAALTGKISWDSANKAYRLNAANQTYDGYNFVGKFLANANQLNLTFTRSYFNAAISTSGCFNNNGHAWGSLTFIDCEYNGNGPSDGSHDSSAGPYGIYGNQGFMGLGAPNDIVTLNRCNLHNGTDNIDCPSANLTITNCYIHDNAFYWAASGVDTHSDPVQFFTVATPTYTASINGTTTLVVSSGPFGALSPGSLVIGSGIPTGTTVVSVTSSTTIVMSAAATTSGSTSIYLTAPIHDVLIQHNYISGNTPSSGINSALQMGHFANGCSITNFQFVDNWIDGPHNQTAFTGGVTPDVGITAGVFNSTIDRNRLGLTTYTVRNSRFNVIWGPNNVWDVSGTTSSGAVVTAGQVIP